MEGLGEMIEAGILDSGDLALDGAGVVDRAGFRFSCSLLQCALVGSWCIPRAVAAGGCILHTN